MNARNVPVTLRAPLLAAALGLLALGAPFTEAATVYKWTDQNGQVHYGHNPPRGTDAHPMRIVEDRPTGGDSQDQLNSLVEKAGLTPEQMDATRREQAARKAEQATDDAQREAACANARGALAELENWAHRAAVRDSQGNIHRLDDVQREALIERTRRTAEENCR